MDRVNWERRVLLLAEELGRSERHPVTLRVIMRPPSQGPVGRGQLGLTGPQRERGHEGEMAALTTGSPECRLGFLPLIVLAVLCVCVCVCVCVRAHRRHT